MFHSHFMTMRIHPYFQQGVGRQIILISRLLQKLNLEVDEFIVYLVHDQTDWGDSFFGYVGWSYGRMQAGEANI